MQLYLFVQEGCRPCMYVETQLKKAEGWEEVVEIVNAKDENGEWCDLAKRFLVDVTPTLVTFDTTLHVGYHNPVMNKLTGANNMGSDFWKSLVSYEREWRKKHGNV